MRKPNAKERILEAAGALFHQKGYSCVGINEIIEKAGTAKASFYQHFPSKESLCETWLRSIHESSESVRNQLLAGEGTPIEKLKAYFDELETYLVERQYRGCPYSNTGAVSDENCAGIIAEIRNHKQSIRRFFRTLAGEVIPDPSRSEEIGDRIFLLYSGAAGESQNLREIWPVRVACAAAVELFTL